MTAPPTESPDLASWLTSALTPLFTSRDDAEWDSAFSTAFASNVTMNLAHLGEGIHVDEAQVTAVWPTTAPGEGQRVQQVTGDEARSALRAQIKPASPPADSQSGGLQRNLGAGGLTRNIKAEFEDVNIDQSSSPAIATGTISITRNMAILIRAAPMQNKTLVKFRAEIDVSGPHIITWAQTMRHTGRPDPRLIHLPVEPPGGRKKVEL